MFTIWCCEFESRSGRGVQHYVIKFVGDLLQVGGFLRVLRFGESGAKHHQPPKKAIWITRSIFCFLSLCFFFACFLYVIKQKQFIIYL